MSIQFGGVGSGLPVQDWINALMQAESTRLTSYQQSEVDAKNAKSTLSTVESKFSSLRSSIEKLTDANLASSMDLFERKTTTSSDETVATSTVANNASVQKIDLEVESLATSTTAQSTSEIGQTIDGTETFVDLSNKEATEGTFSFYTDGVKHEFTVSDTDTVNDIVNNINNAGISGLTADVNAGKFEIKTDSTQISSFVMGSSADTSDFFNVLHLSTATGSSISESPYDTLFTSTDNVSKVDTSGKIIGNEVNLTGTFDQSSYTFKIGGADFTIDSNTTFQDLISQINSNQDANVNASFDLRTNKLVLTSKDPGKTAINLEDTSGDFLQQVDLITAGGDSLSSQTLGDNAKVYLNGSATALEVNSNTITSDISGITGVTMNLKDTTAAGETISINVDQDTDQVTNAVSDFVDKFNAVINEVDKNTATDGKLSGEYSLVSLRNVLRTTVTGLVSGLSTYDSLGMVGISTGSVGTSVDTDTKTLQLDKDAFLKALQDKPDEVKALLVGDSSQGITGVLQDLKTKVESSLDPTNGYFAARDDSFDSKISDIDNSITREQDRLKSRRDQLTKQFNQMDQYISQMQQQQSALSSL